MEKPTIGIKIADGSYFPVLEEGNPKRKRLVLTTVNDNQESVQIDLYKGEGSELLNASYVGSLLIEDIIQGPKESSEIELKIGFDKDGTLNAEAGDLASGQIESLSVSMASFGEDSMYDVPEFSLDDDLMVPEQFDELTVPLAEGNIDNLDTDSEFDLDSEELSLDDEDLMFDDNEELSLDDEDLMFDDNEELESDLDFEDIPEETSFDSASSVPELVEGELVEGFEDEADDSFQVDSLDEYLEKEPVAPDDSVSALIEGDEDDFTPGFLPESEVVLPREKKGSHPFLVALLVLIAIAAIAGISYLIFRSLQGEDAPDLEAKAGTHSTSSTSSETESSGTTEEPAPEAQAETPVAAAEEAAPEVKSTKEEPGSDETTTVPALTAQESNKILDTTGVWYRIRWGDTLWGISYSFYDSPRDYNQIVKENSIKNPDLIFAETDIFIPSK